MFRPEMKKLARKFLVLMVLVVGLLVLSSGLPGKKALAGTVCCTTCSQQYDDCINSCPNPGMCNAMCNFRLKQCQKTCNPGC